MERNLSQPKNQQQKNLFLSENDKTNELINGEPLSQKIYSIIDTILGQKVDEAAKEGFLKSVSLIIRKHTRELQDLVELQKSEIDQSTSIPNNSFRTNSPSVNIYLVNTPTNAIYPQNSAQYYSIPNSNPQYLYSNGYQQQAFQQPFQQPYQQQAFPQPNFLYGLQQQQSFIEAKKHKSSTKKYKHKSKSKDKKSKSKNKKKEKKDKSENIMTIGYDGSQQLNGIMRYLSDLTHSNIVDNGTIDITSNSSSLLGDGPRNLVNYYNEDCYRPSTSDFVNIIFDFKDKSIQPTHYAIKSLNNGPSINGPFLRNWVIQVSNDKVKWTQIDERRDDSKLRKSLVVGVFEIQQKPKEFYRYFRLLQTGNSWDQNGSGIRIILRGMEFYGKIKMPPKT